MPPGLASLRPRNVFYGWYIVAAAAASNFLILGILLFTFGAFVKPIQEEMGWSVAAISIGISIRGFQQGTLSPVTGYLIDWFGPRRTGITGVTIGAVGLVIFSLAQDLWVYYLAFGGHRLRVQPRGLRPLHPGHHGLVPPKARARHRVSELG